MLNKNVFQNFFTAGMQSLQLTQIEGYNPLKEFTDSSGKDWKHYEKIKKALHL